MELCFWGGINSPKQLDTNLPSIHPDLTLTYHNPNEGFQLHIIKKVVDINLT